MKFDEIKEELQGVLKGKTLDTIFPPLVFFIAYQFLDLLAATVIGLIFALLITVYRLVYRASVIYSIFGFFGIIGASSFALFMGNVNDYFLPGIIGSILLVVITLLSLIIKRPLPLLLSHLTRGWQMEWFLRKDIYPAYFEAGIFWFFYFSIRALLQVIFYLNGNLNGLTLMSTLFGFPLTTLVLVLTYIYGIYRLKTLKGPGIEEFIHDEQPPYKGQTRGF